MDSFTTLQAWQRGVDLVEEIYRLTRAFPVEEKFCLIPQLRRAATSVVANIAEGFSRISPNDKKHRFIIARGECSEVHSYLLCAQRIGIVTEESIMRALQLVMETGKLISGMIHYQNTRSHELTTH